MRLMWLSLGLLALAACDPVPISPERAADICEAQARAAQGPTGRIAIGTNSNSGPFTSAEIGISGDYLAVLSKNNNKQHNIS